MLQEILEQAQVQNVPNVIILINTLSVTILAFFFGIIITPLLTNFLYKNKLGKNIRDDSWDGTGSPVFQSMHSYKKGTPTMAGILFWGITAIFTLFNLSREETFLPLFFLVLGGFLGALDDFFNIKGIGKIKGLGVKIKISLQMLIALFGAYWFIFKLNWTSIHIPGGGLFGLPVDFELGLWYIPIFILVVIFVMNSVDITDGLDGLLAGSIIPTFSSLAVLAFIQGKYSLVMFICTLIGALAAFLWFNIHPARFFMGGTGAFALGATLSVISVVTNSLFILPIIGFLFFVEGGSSILQLLSKKFLKRKIFISAPIHHHFQAIGWDEPKIVMRFWIVSWVMSILGLILGIIGMR